MTSPITAALMSINQYKNDISLDESFNKTYPKFPVQKILSDFRDSFPFAAIVNELPGLTPTQHYHFLLHTVPKRNRFSPRKAKQTNDNDLVNKYIPLVFECGHKEAEFIAEVLTPQQKLEIIQCFQAHGSDNVKRKRKRTDN